ncbi:hypothetical protein ACVW1C_000257 [Bradyrhizobium sp. USDA 4011]
MSKLNGIELSRRDPALSDEEQFAIFAEMGAALLRINDITLDSFGYIGPNGVWTPHQTNRTYMSAQFERKLAEFFPGRRRGAGRAAPGRHRRPDWSCGAGWRRSDGRMRLPVSVENSRIPPAGAWPIDRNRTRHPRPGRSIRLSRDDERRMRSDRVLRAV